jgi:hypothetical protein
VSFRRLEVQGSGLSGLLVDLWGCRSGSWLCQDGHSKCRGSSTLPWALPYRRVLVAVISVRPGLPSPFPSDTSSTVPTIIPQTPRVTLHLELTHIVQPITVRDEQLLEASGKILDHIVSERSADETIRQRCQALYYRSCGPWPFSICGPMLLCVKVVYHFISPVQ